MHVELSKLPMESFKDLAKHYLMIVLGIVTALGLEAWVENVHHRHAAEIASAQIEAEIRENKVEIEKARDRDLARKQMLGKLREALIKDIKSNATNDTVIEHIHELAPDGLYLDWRWPPLRHEAWDVAVANQSAGWIDSQRLHRYATVYAAQNFYNAEANTITHTALDGPRMVDAMADLDIGEVEARPLLHIVTQMWGTVADTSSSLAALDQKIDEAMSARSPVSR